MKRALYSLSVLSILALAPAEAREFTNKAGKTISAEIESVSGEGADRKVTLKRADGKSFTIVADTLSDDDQTFISDFAAEAAKGPSAFDSVLEGKLVKLDGKRVGKFVMTEKPDYYAFYYSASWCGPCRKFTPDLVSFYNEHKDAGKKFEIVFVSSDRDADAMEAYMKEDKFPFPGVKFRSAKDKEIKQYAGSGIPCLVLLDRDGKILSDSYVDGNYVGPRKVLADLQSALGKE